MRAHIVQQGEHLAGLAARMGFEASEVWSHEANAELRERRSDPQRLAPGDVLFVPEPEPPTPLDVRPKTENRFVAPMPSARLSLQLTEGGDGAFANQPYRIEGLARTIEGTTDGEGRLSESVPVQTRRVRLVFPERDAAYTIALGHMSPPESMSAARDGLRHLGFLPAMELVDPWAGGARDTDVEADETREALLAFQRAHQLAETGENDEATRAALEEACRG